MVQELPPEIFDEITGYLWDDKSALGACSLASRILTTPSHKHLFSCIILRASWELFDRQRYPHVYSMGGTSANFLRLLGASPHISGYVDCLQIIDIKTYEEPTEFSSSDDDDNDNDDDDDNDSQNDWLSDDKSLPLILPHLQNLKALVVDFVQNWKNLSKEIRSSLFRVLQLPSLRYLELTPFPISLLTQAVHDNIKHLYIRTYCRSKTIKNVLVPGPGMSGPIYLDSLYAGCMDDFRILEPQRNCRFKTDRLRKVGLDVDGAQDHGSTLTLLQSCSNTLEEFIFLPTPYVLWKAPTTAGYQEPIDISKLTSLRKLTVCPIFGGDFGAIFWWLNKFLRACSAPNRLLDEITIQVRHRSPESRKLDLQHWKDISDALLSDYFPCLKWLHISISSLMHIKYAEELVEQLNASKFIATLQSHPGLNVDLTSHYFSQDIQFAPDRRWENVSALTDMPDEGPDSDDDM